MYVYSFDLLWDELSQRAYVAILIMNDGMYKLVSKY